MANGITLVALIRCCYVSSLCCVEEEVLSFQLTGLISLFLLLSLLFSLKFGCLPVFSELFHSLGSILLGSLLSLWIVSRCSV